MSRLGESLQDILENAKQVPTYINADTLGERPDTSGMQVLDIVEEL